VLQPGGTLLLSVPAAHLFSFLDPDNAKLRWPRLHRQVWRIRRGVDAQERDARGQRATTDMIGDLAVERSEHTNFRPADIAAAVTSAGLHVESEEGSGLFYRWFQIPSLLLPGAAGRLAERLVVADARRFGGSPGTGLRRRANLLITAVKPSEPPPTDDPDDGAQGRAPQAKP
jgi:hypothetical protein